MPIKITITVDGPGMLINYEMFIIEEALRAAGITVNVINEHSDDSPQLEQLSLSQQFINENPGIHQVSLVAKHHPWGG